MENLNASQFIKTFKLIKKYDSLDKIDSLDNEVKSLLIVSGKFKEKIDNNDNYKLKSSWKKITEVFSFKGDKPGVRFVIWTAKVQYQKKRIYNDDKTEILPMDQITDYYTVPVVFFEKNKSIYSCIITKNTNKLNHVKRLIGANNIDPSGSGISTEEKFVEWLFWRNEKNKVLSKDENIALDTLIGFEGILSIDDNSDLIKGSSEQLPDLKIMKTVIALEEPLKSAKIVLNLGDSHLQFFYSINGLVGIDYDNTQLDSNLSRSIAGNIDLYKKLVYIIAYVIPKLLDLFTNDAQNFENEFDEFKKESALNVIDSLCEINNIEIDEIKGIGEV